MLTDACPKVSHSNPFRNANSCVDASSAAYLYTQGTHKDLDSCLDALRVVLAHPHRGPLMLKLEMKIGFSANGRLGPDQLEATLHAHLGDTATPRPV